MKLVQKNKMDFEWIFICFHNSHSKQKVKQVVHFDLFNSLNYTKKTTLGHLLKNSTSVIKRRSIG